MRDVPSWIKWRYQRTSSVADAPSVCLGACFHNVQPLFTHAAAEDKKADENDGPSTECLSVLRRHYKLCSYYCYAYPGKERKEGERKSHFHSSSPAHSIPTLNLMKEERGKKERGGRTALKKKHSSLHWRRKNLGSTHAR